MFKKLHKDEFQNIIFAYKKRNFNIKKIYILL